MANKCNAVKKQKIYTKLLLNILIFIQVLLNLYFIEIYVIERVSSFKFELLFERQLCSQFRIAQVFFH